LEQHKEETMKKITMLVAMICMLAATGFAQKVNLIGSSASSDIWAVLNWGPFSSDSVTFVMTGNFNISEYDSLSIWAKGTSSDGAPKWSAQLYAGFGSTVSIAALDSIGTAADTTSVKLETLQYIGTLPTYGAAVGAFSVKGSAVTGILNRADAKVNIYAVGRKRAYTGNR